MVAQTHQSCVCVWCVCVLFFIFLVSRHFIKKKKLFRIFPNHLRTLNRFRIPSVSTSMCTRLNVHFSLLSELNRTESFLFSIFFYVISLSVFILHSVFFCFCFASFHSIIFCQSDHSTVLHVNCVGLLLNFDSIFPFFLFYFIFWHFPGLKMCMRRYNNIKMPVTGRIGNFIFQNCTHTIPISIPILVPVPMFVLISVSLLHCE